MPGSITASWRTRCAVSRPNAGFHIRRSSCWISPGAKITQPIVSTAEALTGDRPDARMDFVDDDRVDGIHHATGTAEALVDEI